MPAAGEPLLAGCLLPVSQSGYVRDGDGFVETRRAAPTPGPGLLAGARRRRGRPSRRGGGGARSESRSRSMFLSLISCLGRHQTGGQETEEREG